MVKDTTLYDRLGVNPTSSDNEIKKGYRKMSMKFHPDKNKDPSATTKFQEISEAYNILTDQKKRDEYDIIGMDILKQQDMGDFDPSDIFNNFFGGMGGFPFPGGVGGFPFPGDVNMNNNHQDPCVSEFTVSLKDLYCKKEIKVEFKRKEYCKKCNGYGTKDGTNPKCKKCDGRGKTMQVIQRGNMIQQCIIPCTICNGTGSFLQKSNCCTQCDKGINIKEAKIDLPLNHNMYNNCKVTIKNEGNKFREYTSDLILILNLEENIDFKKENDNIHHTIYIPFYQSIFGLSYILKYLDEKQYYINYNKFINNNDILEIKGKGFNNGSLLITIKVKPLNVKKYSVQELEILKKLLSKNNLEDLHLENGIKQEKSNYQIIKPKKMIINYEDSTQETNNNNIEEPQCVQQ